MIERHETRQQIVCDTCPASFPQSYAEDDFAVMVADVKAAGWAIRKRQPDATPRDTSDLFGAAPRVAGKEKQQPYTHACPTCRAKPQPQGRLM